MKPTQLRLKMCLAVFCIMALFACLRNAGQEVTSTSVTTGNPTGLRIIFRKDFNPVFLNGTVDIYAADQIPVHAYSPNPLLSLRLRKASSIEIDSRLIAAIPDSLWPSKSVEGDSIRRINAVISSDSLGSILKGIVFQKDRNGFKFTMAGSILTQDDLHFELNADLGRLTNYIATTDTNKLGFSMAWNFHLFIYGTGFTAKGEGGVFKISNLPIGQHEAFILYLPGSHAPLSGDDSTSIISLIGGMHTERDTIYPGPTHDRVELPDSLKRNSGIIENSIHGAP